jgi:hypothetical protein
MENQEGICQKKTPPLAGRSVSPWATGEEEGVMDRAGEAPAAVR